jgi:trehalose 6-phosphate phosphatase
VLGYDLLAPLVEAPDATALVFDVDGTLAPIAPRPEHALVPDETRVELRRLVERYALVACLSGRAALDARRLVGVDGIEYVGNHGLELHPDARVLATAIARFRDAVGLPVEDKGISLAYHYREAADEDAARAELESVAQSALLAGLDARWGRKVLEVRPRVEADKGTAIRTLIDRAKASRALYAGDDTTDIDAFRGLAEAQVEYAVRIAVASDEGPKELQDAADLVVPDPTQLTELLRRL